MTSKYKIRIQWMKFMYLYTAIGAGITGFMILLMPGSMMKIMSIPPQDPFILGVTSSSFLAYGVISILGFRSPLKFVAVLLLQLTYKCIWFLLVVLPLFLDKQVPAYIMPMIVIFATYIIGDIIAIPFGHVLRRRVVKGIRARKMIKVKA